jgi:hypothetical protein
MTLINGALSSLVAKEYTPALDFLDGQVASILYSEELLLAPLQFNMTDPTRCTTTLSQHVSPTR